MVLPEPTNWFKKYRADKLKFVKLWYCQCPFDIETVNVTIPNESPKDASMQIRSEDSEPSKW